MNVYLSDVKLAILSFFVLSIFLTIPYIYRQYNKYGSVSKIRIVIIFSLLLYLLCAYYLVILPLPNPDTVNNAAGPFTQFIPFNFVADFIRETSLNIKDTNTYLIALKENVVIQPIFNIILTIPFGIFLGFYLKKDMKKTIFITFLLSLFFELTQLSGLYGIYKHPYRLFDIDDLMLNTFGGLVGFFIYKQFLSFLPSKENIDEKNYNKSRKVGYIRRLFALWIDYIIFTIIYISVTSVFNINNTNEIYYLNSILLIIFLLFLQLLFKQTVGKALVHIKIESENTQKHYLAVVKRYSILLIPFIILFVLENYANIYEGIYFILIAFIIDFLYSLKKEKRLFYERFSKTNLVNTIFQKE